MDEKSLILSREEAWLLHNKHPQFFIPEENMEESLQHFIITKCIDTRPKFSSDTNTDFWLWCCNNLKGKVRCMSSNKYDDEDCWGFTNEHDIAFFVLKWG